MVSPASPDPLKIVEVDPAKVHPAPGNRVVTPADVGEIAPSIQADGQLVPAILFSHPSLPPDEYYSADGSHRTMACRILGKMLKAIILATAPTEDELSKMRVAANFLLKKASAYEIGPEILAWMKRNGKNQKQASVFYHLSEATISKILGKVANACPEVVQAEKSGEIVEDVGRLLATLPKDQQPSALAYVIANTFTRDQVEGHVATLKCRHPKDPPAVEVKESGATIKVPGDWTWQRVIDLATKLQAAAKKAMKVEGMTIQELPGLLRS